MSTSKGAGRPVRRREDFGADISALGRLRTALMLDGRVTSEAREKALTAIDDLATALITIHHSIQIKKSA